MIWSEQNAWKRWFHLTWFRFCPLMGSRDSGPKWAVGGKSSNRRQNPTNTSSWHRNWWIGSFIWRFGSWWWWRNCTIQLDATDISHRMFCWFVMVGQWVTESLFGTKFVSNKWSYSGIQSKQYCLKLKKKHESWAPFLIEIVQTTYDRPLLPRCQPIPELMKIALRWYHADSIIELLHHMSTSHYKSQF